MSARGSRALLGALLGGLLTVGCQSGPQARATSAKADPDTADTWIASRLAATSKPTPPPPTGVKPVPMVVRIVSTYPHDPEAFTQGLTMRQGVLYESTGLNGASSVRRVDVPSGRVLQQVNLPEEMFAEGLTWVGERLFLVTLSSLEVYDVNSFAKVHEVTGQPEHWGVCFDGTQLITSNGSDTLVMRDPATFQETGRVRVKIEGLTFWMGNLNSIECVGDSVYANVWPTHYIARIDRRTGDITAVIDISALPILHERDYGARAMNGLVPNGIAYRSETDTFLLTGKMWNQLYEVKLVPAP